MQHLQVERIETPAVWAQWVDPSASANDHRGELLEAGDVGLFEASFVELADARLQRVAGPPGEWPGRSARRENVMRCQYLTVDEERARGPEPQRFERHPLLEGNRLSPSGLAALATADLETVRDWLAGPWEAVAPGGRRELERVLNAKRAALEQEAAAIAGARAELDPAVIDLRLERERRPAVRVVLEERLDVVRRAMREDAEHRRAVFAQRYPGNEARAASQLAAFELRLERYLEREERQAEKTRTPKWEPANLF